MPRLTLTQSVLALALAASPLSAQSWSTEPDIVPARWNMDATAVGGRALFAGGGTNTTLYDTVDTYDPSSGAWTQMTLSSARVFMAAVTLGDEALFAGGYGGPMFLASTVVDIYDANADSWSTASLSEARYGMAATTVGGYALFAGGVPVQFGTPDQSDRVDVYEAATDDWTQTSLSVARQELAATSVGPYALFAGGKGSGGHTDVVDVYDSSIGSPTNPAAWSQVALSQARYQLTAVSDGTRAYFASGQINMAGIPVDVTTVDIYDSSVGPPSNPAAWSVEQLSVPRRSMAAVAQGGRVLFAGGAYSFFDPTMGFMNFDHDSVDVFDPATGTWSVEQLSLARNSLAVADLGDRAVFAGGATPNDGTPAPWDSGAVDVRVLGQWVDHGKALPPMTGSAPELGGAGNLAAGGALTLTLTDAAPASPAWLVLGVNELCVPFKGGTLVPSPDLLLPLTTGSAGEFNLPTTWPAGVPAGLSVYLQAWIPSAAGPSGFVASNGLEGITE